MTSIQSKPTDPLSQHTIISSRCYIGLENTYTTQSSEGLMAINEARE